MSGEQEDKVLNFCQSDGWKVLSQYSFHLCFFLLWVKLNIFHVSKDHFSILFVSCPYLLDKDFWPSPPSVFKSCRLGYWLFICDICCKYSLPVCHVSFDLVYGVFSHAKVFYLLLHLGFDSYLESLCLYPGYRGIDPCFYLALV